MNRHEHLWCDGRCACGLGWATWASAEIARLTEALAKAEADLAVMTDDERDVHEALATERAARLAAETRLHAQMALMRAACDALRSYQYGNNAVDLAEEVADALAAALGPAPAP